MIKTVDNWGEFGPSDQIEANILNYFQWGFLTIGAFSNVMIPTTGVYGGQFHKLTPVKDPRRTDGQVWQSARKDWVWENPVDYGVQPIRVSGVNIRSEPTGVSVFYPIDTTGSYSHYVNYPLGQVVFNTAISPSSEVTLEYSIRNVGFVTADVPWFSEVVFNSFRVDEQQAINGSGIWAVLAENKVQLPTVVIESVPNVSKSPYEIGSHANYHRQDVLLHVLSSSRFDFKSINDVLVDQWEANFMTFDKKAMETNNAFPLDYRGMVASGAIMYTGLIEQFPWKQMRIADVRGTAQATTPPLYMSTIRLTTELILN